MFNKNSLKALLILLLVAIFIPLHQADAGVFSDIKMWYQEKSNISQHGRIISGEVKTLYRERKSIQSFAEGASSLVKAYQAIKNKSSKASLPQLLDIARSITNVVNGFKTLAPKAEAMYKNSQASLKYFAQMADKTETIQSAKNKIVVKSFSDNRVNKLAGANGWTRVFDSVKSNPMNIFKWGQLQDEYKMGKIEAQYPLKCAQIAFEASAYYFAARDSIQELLGIQNEIKGIMDGDLASILNLGSTVTKIQNSGNSIEAIGALAETAATNVSKRFDELIKVQNEYVAASKSYNEKYNKAATSSSTASAPVARTTVSTQTSSNTVTSGSSNAPVSLKTAMASYQKAYEVYVELSQSGSASQSEMNKAISTLQKAKQQVEQAKAQQAR